MILLGVNSSWMLRPNAYIIHLTAARRRFIISHHHKKKKGEYSTTDILREKHTHVTIMTVL